MSEPGAEELGPTTIANGSAPPEDKGVEISENKGQEDVKVSEEMKDSEEKKDGEENEDSEEKKDGEEKEDNDEKEDEEEKEDSEEMKDVVENKDTEEKKDNEDKKDVEEIKDNEVNKDGEDNKENEENKNGDENGVRTEEEEEAEKEEKKTEDADMVEAEDVTMAEAVDVKDEEEVVKDEGLNLEEEKDDGDIEKKVDENKQVDVPTRKRGRGQKIAGKGEAKEKKEGGTKVKELTSTPAASSTERPVRERKTVERLVEVIEKEPDRGLLIKKGLGTPLKDIPNVAYKLARKKPADLKLLHQILFGRKGKAVNFKNHLLQFSGFVWHENDEKQRAKVKEKLDKCVKDILLDLCDLFDMAVSKTTTRKEDLVVKLLDFMAAPHATTDVILAEDEQQSAKSRKRKRVAKGTASKSMGDTPVKQSQKKRTKSEGIPNKKGTSAQETDDEEEDDDDDENGVPDEDEALKHSDSDAKESESEEAGEEDEDEDEDGDEDSNKSKQDLKKSSKRGSAKKEKMKVGAGPKKAPLTTAVKSPTKPSSKLQAEGDEVGAKVFTRKKKIVDAPKKKISLKPDKKEKATGKTVATGRGKSEEAKQSAPSKEELRKTICEILKQVDFNTATFTDILKQLATHYNMDLKARKSSIKLLIQEELTKLADAAEENEDDEEEEDTGKGDNPKPAGKELEA